MSDLTTINAPTYNITQFELMPNNATMTNLMAHYWITLSRAQISMPSGTDTKERVSLMFINKSNHDLDAALNIANVEADDLREDLISDNFDVFAREQDHMILIGLITPTMSCYITVMRGQKRSIIWRICATRYAMVTTTLE